MKLLAPILTAACALLWFAAASANADAHVDRNFGMGGHPQQGSSTSPLSMFPKNASPQPGSNAIGATALSNTDSDNDPHGSYSVHVVSATMYSKNVVYVTPFPLPPHIAGARVTINNVVWQYGTKTQPSGFEAALCWKNKNTCVNVSRLGTGQTRNFNGKDALQPFFLQYQVIGTGTLSPSVIGDTAQIIVSYRIWQ
jgi:hypothetical protein